MSYTKLSKDILTSTVWMENDHTRICWLTLLAMKDRHGEVHASIPGLANVARIPIDACRAAIQVFLSPDPDSRTKTDDGKRIEVIDGGWVVINHDKYCRASSDDEKREQAATRQERYRARTARNSNAKSVTERDGALLERDGALLKGKVTHSNARKLHVDVDVDVDVENKHIAGSQNSSSNPEAKAAEAAGERVSQKDSNQGQSNKTAPPVDLFLKDIPRQGLSSENAPKAKPERQRNPAFDVLAKVCGIDLASMTPPEAKRVAKALGDIKHTLEGLSPEAVAEEIQRRAENYRLNMPPGSTLTPTALSNNWGLCSSARAQPQKPVPLWLEIQQLEQTISTHRANKEWTGFKRENATEELRAELRALIGKLNKLKGTQ